MKDPPTLTAAKGLWMANLTKAEDHLLGEQITITMHLRNWSLCLTKPWRI